MEKEKRGGSTAGKALEGDFLELLKGVFGGNLRSVVVYGSYGSGSFVKGVSDINLLIVLDSSVPGQLEELGRRGGRAMRRLDITPLVLTRSEFLSSADVFPMEYLDIEARHRVLYGEDVTRSLEVSMKNLRHQLEDRLRGMAAALRKLLIASGGSERFLARHLSGWLGPSGALLRGLLRLKGVPNVPLETEGLLRTVRDAFDLDTEPFLRLAGIRRGGRRGCCALARDLLSSLEKLTVTIDGMKA